MVDASRINQPDDRAEWPRVNLGTVSLDAVPLDQVCETLDKLRRSERPDYVCFCEAHLWTRAVSEPAVAAALRHASLVLPDGVSMMIAARLLGVRLPTRAPGPTVLIEYCRAGVAAGVRHFFYGGAPGVAAALADALQRQIPEVRIAGTYSPPFGPVSAEHAARIREMIRQSNADVVWVGLGAPKQELWMRRHAGLVGVPLMLGVGAAFDFHSGRRKWAPRWVRRVGMEWLFRMLTGGPSTCVRYVKVVPRFLWLIGCTVVRCRILKITAQE